MPEDKTKNLPGQGPTDASPAKNQDVSKEDAKAVVEERKEATELQSMPSDHGRLADGDPAVDLDPKLVNFDHDAEANLTEEQKGATTSKFDGDGFGARDHPKRSAAKK